MLISLFDLIIICKKIKIKKKVCFFLLLHNTKEGILMNVKNQTTLETYIVWTLRHFTKFFNVLQKTESHSVLE